MLNQQVGLSSRNPLPPRERQSQARASRSLGEAQRERTGGAMPPRRHRCKFWRVCTGKQRHPGEGEGSPEPGCGLRLSRFLALPGGLPLSWPSASSHSPAGALESRVSESAGASGLRPGSGGLPRSRTRVRAPAERRGGRAFRGRLEGLRGDGALQLQGAPAPLRAHVGARLPAVGTSSCAAAGRGSSRGWPWPTPSARREACFRARYSR